MTLVDNLDSNPHFGGVHFPLVRRVAAYALVTVVFHEGCLLWFSTGFSLINRVTLFFLINENSESFFLFQNVNSDNT